MKGVPASPPASRRNVNPPAIDLQMRLRIAPPPSIQILVVDCTLVGGDGREIRIEHGHLAVRAIAVPLDDGAGTLGNGRHIVVRVLQIHVGLPHFCQPFRAFRLFRGSHSPLCLRASTRYISSALTQILNVDKARVL